MRVSPVSLEEIKLTCLFIWIFHTLLTILWSLIKSCIYQGRHTGYGWYGFHRTRFFWSRWVFLSLYSEYEIEFRVWYEIPNSIVKLTFHIHPALLLFDAKVERQPRSIAIFYSNIFPAVNAMQWPHAQTYYASRMFYLHPSSADLCDYQEKQYDKDKIF